MKYTEKELKDGEIYKTISSDKGVYIFLYEKNEGSHKFIDGDSYHRNGWLLYSNNKSHFPKNEYYETTSLEKRWLRECIKQDKLVPMPKQRNYAIY